MFYFLQNEFNDKQTNQKQTTKVLHKALVALLHSSSSSYVNVLMRTI